MKEHGLRIILQMMGRCNPITCKLLTGTPEEIISKFSRGFFQPDPMLECIGSHISLFREKRDFSLPAPALNKGTVTIRFLSPEGMVKMGRTDRNSKTLRILQKQMEHAHGIRPAGDGTEHLHPGAEHIITGDFAEWKAEVMPNIMQRL
jgi:hypothetical protein